MDVSRPKDKTNILKILQRVAEDTPARGMIVLISDLFVDRDPLFRGLEMLRHARHDILVYHVLDDDEMQFPFAGTTRFEGMEELDQVLCDPRSRCAAMELPLKAQNRNRRRLIIEQLLLLFLRCMLVALLGLLVSRLVPQSAAATGEVLDYTHIVLVDNSLSMNDQWRDKDDN